MAKNNDSTWTINVIEYSQSFHVVASTGRWPGRDEAPQAMPCIIIVKPGIAVERRGAQIRHAYGNRVWSPWDHDVRVADDAEHLQELLRTTQEEMAARLGM